MNISEEHIEKFVRYPEALSEMEKERVRNVISSSSKYKALANWFEQFYDDLDSTGNQKKGMVIPLRVSDYHSKGGYSEKRLVLAAKSEEESNKEKLETVVTYISEREQIVVRVLKNNETGVYQFHMLQGEDSDRDICLLHLANVEIDILIDQSRHVSFRPNRELEGINWENQKAFLRFPQSHFKIAKQELLALYDGKTIVKTGIRLQLESQETESILMVAKENAESADIKRLLLSTGESDRRTYRFETRDNLKINMEQVESLECWMFN